jgi:hypothetical protein
MSSPPSGASPKVTHPTIETPTGLEREDRGPEIALADPLIDVLVELVKIILEEEGCAPRHTP